jgi:hypothetical protein
MSAWTPFRGSWWWYEASTIIVPDRLAATPKMERLYGYIAQDLHQVRTLIGT